MTEKLSFPFPKPPVMGQMIEVAEGILWLRLPLPMALDHVNCFILAGEAGWTIYDCGPYTPEVVALWQDLLAGPLAHRPIERLIVSHHHLDHVGMAGWFQKRGVALHMSRTAWLFARMLALDVQESATPEQIDFWRGAGLSPERLAAKAAERPFNTADRVHPMPLGFIDLREGQRFTLAGRDFTVRLGSGHAPDHASLWAEDVILGGDQLLPAISANLGAYASEPLADPVADWLQSCRRFLPLAQEAQLVLPGHKLPYRGLPFRLVQMIENHENALERLMDFLQEPRRAVDCFALLFKRRIGPDVESLALAEAMAHLNHLYLAGKIGRERDASGAWIWRRP